MKQWVLTGINFRASKNFSSTTRLPLQEACQNFGQLLATHDVTLAHTQLHVILVVQQSLGYTPTQPASSNIHTKKVEQDGHKWTGDEQH